MNINFSWKKRMLWAPPVLLGILALFLAPLTKKAPPQNNQTTSVKVVRFIKMTPRKVQPKVIGYGYIKPANEWQAQSELSGSVIWTSENLENGLIFNKGDIVLKIDPAPFLLTKAQLEAQIEISGLKDKTIQSLLEIAQKDFTLQKEELDRFERLLKTGHISKTARDASKIKYLNSQQQVQTLKNNLLINKAEKKVLSSQLAIIDWDLEKTIVRAPFDIRVTDVNIGISEYINKGALLFKGDGLDAAEVSAQFSIGKMRPLRRFSKKRALTDNSHSDLNAIVELQAIDQKIKWKGTVERTGGMLDTQTQSQTIVVRIATPYKKASPGNRPPLLRNTFVKVTLRSKILDEQLLLPITAIHNDKVYLLDAKNRLQIKPIKIDFIQGQLAVISEGLSIDDKVILTPLSPAIEGMKLKIIEDQKILEWLDNTTGFTLNSVLKDQESL